MASWLAGIAIVEAFWDDEPMMGEVERPGGMHDVDCLLHLDSTGRSPLIRFTSLGYYSFPAYVTLHRDRVVLPRCITVKVR